MLTYEFLRVCMPYCLQRQPDGSYILLNRAYKPIGFATQCFIDYAAHPIGVRLRGLGPKAAKELSWKGDSDLSNIYLYSDGCAPTLSAANMAAYQKRLARLMKLKVVIDSLDEFPQSALAA
jgi:hypothetical protein